MAQYSLILQSTIPSAKRDERTENQQDLPRPGRPQKICNTNIERLYRRAKRDNIQIWDTFLQYAPVKRRRGYQRLLDIDPDFKKRQQRWRPNLEHRDARLRCKHEREHRALA